MKIFVIFVLLFSLTGCVSDVSNIPPHDKLAGTIWKLKADAYIVQFKDRKKQLYIIPNTKSFSVYLRGLSVEGEPYNEENIGRKTAGGKIVGGLRAGESLKVLRVLKHPHIEMGTWYIPIMIPEKSNQWTGNKELSGHKLYRNFYDKGILNPECAELVGPAEGGSGSEEINL